MRSVIAKKYVEIRKRLIGSGIGSFYPVKKVNEILLSKLKQKYTIVNGYKMFLDDNDSLELSINPEYEPEETAIIKLVVNLGDVVVDIGSHIGYYTLLLSGLVGSTGKVYAFEPDPKNYSLLRMNVDINGIKNVVTVNKAITDRKGLVSLYPGAESQNPSLAGKGEPTVVYGTTLDDYFVGLENKIDLIKMDIEGGEYSAVLGMNSVIEKNPDLILITELYPEALSKFGVSESEYLSLLKSNGFTCADICCGGVVRNLICRRDGK